VSATSANGDVGPMSPHGDIDVDDTVNCAGMDMLIVRAHCCRDWPVLALARMGRCGYCGQIPVVVGPCVADTVILCPGASKATPGMWLNPDGSVTSPVPSDTASSSRLLTTDDLATPSETETGR